MDLTIESYQSVKQAILPKPATGGPDSSDLSEGSDYESSTTADEARARGVTKMGGYGLIPPRAKDMKDAEEDMSNDPTCIQPLNKFNAAVTGIIHVCLKITMFLF